MSTMDRNNSVDTTINTSALDVANYILDLAEGEAMAIDQFKLQKVLFYCQCWSVLDGKKLFADPVKAWKWGPAIRSVWVANSGHTTIPSADSAREYELSEDQKYVIRSVWTTLKHLSGTELSDRTHEPDMAWRRTRGGLPDYAHSDKEISLAEMAREARVRQEAASNALSNAWEDAIKYQE